MTDRQKAQLIKHSETILTALKVEEGMDEGELAIALDVVQALLDYAVNLRTVGSTIRRLNQLSTKAVICDAQRAGECAQ